VFVTAWSPVSQNYKCIATLYQTEEQSEGILNKPLLHQKVTLVSDGILHMVREDQLNLTELTLD
jgi:hypothetical protein